MKLKNEEGFILSAVKLDYKATGSKLWDTGAGIRVQGYGCTKRSVETRVFRNRINSVENIRYTFGKQN